MPTLVYMCDCPRRIMEKRNLYTLRISFHLSFCFCLTKVFYDLYTLSAKAQHWQEQLTAIECGFRIPGKKKGRGGVPIC